MNDNVTTIAALRAAIEDRDAIIAELNKEIDCIRAELFVRDVDELTGLHNLRWLREFWSSLRVPSSVIGAVVFMDVDLLKRINDTYGHKTGNRVITHVAAILAASGCYCVRYGGDEFLILVPAGWDVERTVDLIVERIAESPIPVSDGEIKVVVSCGARIVPPVDTDLHQLIHDADYAMYEVKRARTGGCRIVQ